MTDVKLAGTPEAPPEPQFPQTNIQLAPNGLIITIAVAPSLAITAAIGAHHMDQIARDWRNLRKEQANQRELVRNIERSKL